MTPTSNGVNAVGFWRSPFIADVKRWGGTAAFCVLISLDYVPR